MCGRMAESGRAMRYWGAEEAFGAGQITASPVLPGPAPELCASGNLGTGRAMADAAMPSVVSFILYAEILQQRRMRAGT
jgi:hypothetical protein